jgi:hypothetical protein
MKHPAKRMLRLRSRVAEGELYSSNVMVVDREARRRRLKLSS